MAGCESVLLIGAVSAWPAVPPCDAGSRTTGSEVGRVPFSPGDGVGPGRAAGADPVRRAVRHQPGADVSRAGPQLPRLPEPAADGVVPGPRGPARRQLPGAACAGDRQPAAAALVPPGTLTHRLAVFRYRRYCGGPRSRPVTGEYSLSEGTGGGPGPTTSTDRLIAVRECSAHIPCLFSCRQHYAIVNTCYLCNILRFVQSTSFFTCTSLCALTCFVVGCAVSVLTRCSRELARSPQ